ncbi:MAG: carboxypeptidase regulatory-like domain-containing protein, partial [Candidatus Diapherotrites archaeon]|nr:carboxypeptidase regulatory-like domain-containing protein [Candidatus Diapherotrites archaeon]
MSIVDSIKKGYFFLEDKYYGVLDRVNEYVPIYKAIDPIDKVFPSFILFMLLVICLIIVFSWLTWPSGTFNSTISVVDVGGNPIQGVAINLLLNDGNISLLTDSWGEAMVELPASNIDVPGLFSKDGYEKLAKMLSLYSGTTTTVTLGGASIIFQPVERVIKVVDGSTNQLLERKVTVTYRCSNGVSAPLTQENDEGTPAEFVVMQPANCSVLTATASASGYERKSKTISSETNYIILNPIAVETTGNVSVFVKESGGSYAPDATVRLIESTTSSVADSTSTSQAGSAYFSGVEPGTYTVSVSSSDGRTAQKTGVLVSAGQTAIVSITLPETLSGKKILLQLIESGTDIAVSNAAVVIYEDGIPIDSRTSTSQGIVERAVTNEDSSYLAVITHPDYLATIEPNIPLKAASDNDPIKVAMTKATPENSAKAIVNVLDEEQQPLSGASVWLYSNSHPLIPLNYVAKVTNADGNALFTNLEPASYFARARHAATEAEGQSQTENISAAQTAVLEITLVVSEGTVEATVYDADSSSKEKLATALVEFIDISDGNVLSSCTTDSAGKCESSPIKADRAVYVEASKSGFMKARAAREIDIAKGKQRVEIGLEHESNYTPERALVVNFIGFCSNVECTSSPSSLQSSPTGENSYYGLFLMTLDTEAEYTNIANHIRVGLDSHIALPQSGYGIKIADARAGWAPGADAFVMSRCWNGNKANPFEDPPACADVSNDAKQANAYYGREQGKISLPIKVKFSIEKGLQDGTEVRFAFKARATVAGETIATDEKLEIFEVGAPIDSRADYSWNFKLKRTDTPGQDFELIVPDSIAGVYPLAQNAEYALRYDIYKSKPGVLSASLTAENSSPEAISFEPLSDVFQSGELFPISPMQIEAGTQYFSEDWQDLMLYPVLETGSTPSEIALNLRDASTGLLEDSHSLYFTVASNKHLLIKGLPSKLSDIGTAQLTGKVVEALNQDTAVEDAYVKAIIPEPLNQEKEADNGGRTDPEGIFTITNIPNLSGVQSVTIEVRKAGFATLHHVIPVGHPQVVPSVDYECISFKTAGLEEIESVSVDRSRSSEAAAFVVDASACADNIEIMLESELALSQNEFSLNNDDSEQITVSALKSQDMPLPPLGIGEYYVHLYAKFESDAAGWRGPLQALRVIVSDSNPELCFRLVDPSNETIMKSSFDISQGRDSGRIVNECFAYIEDLLLPEIRKVHVHASNEEIFSIDYGLPPLDPPQEKTRQRTFDAMPISESEPLAPITLAPGGGFVTLQWVDVFMTDEKHFGDANHRVWAHFFRGENDWLNVTGMLPFTAPGSPGEDTKKAVGLLESPFPVIDNAGWVDTDTYHAGNAETIDDVTSEPIWQAQHNVCYNNIKDMNEMLGTCTVSGYFQGQAVQPYAVGSRADKIKLEVRGNGTKISQVKWHYTNTDPNHNGVIDFDVINNSLSGETYALIEVEDSVEGSGILPDSAIDFGWELLEEGIEESVVSSNPLSAAPAQEILPGQMLALSVDSAAVQKFKLYSYSDANLALAFTELGSSPINVDAISISSPTVSDENVLLLKYYTGSLQDYDPAKWQEYGPMDLELEPGSDAVEFNLENTAQIALVAIANVSDSVSLSVDGLVMEEQLRGVKSTHTSNGTSRIDAGQTSKTFNPTPYLNAGNFDLVEYAISSQEPNVRLYFSDSKLSVTERMPSSPEPIEVTAVVSSPEEHKKTKTELFHIRLEGMGQAGCNGYNGLSGQTGFIAKPRVLLNWDWNSIGIDSCDSENADFIYCDPTQFSIMLVKRLERIRQLASDPIENSDEIEDLRWFNAYLVEDNFNDDFRHDFAKHYSSVAFGQPLQGLHEAGYLWDDYFKSADRMGFKRLLENGNEQVPAEIEAGLYNVFIDFYFDQGQYDFFVDSPEGGLKASVHIIFTKLQDPAIYSPFYYLPFNGNLGLEDGGSYHRGGYGLGFVNSSGAIALTDSLATEFVSTESGSGEKLVSTERVSDYSEVNFSEKGMILEIPREHDEM